MLSCLVICAALSTGQTASAPTDTVLTPTSAAPGPDRWLLMKTLQGTWPGSELDSNRLSLSGWTEFSFTASSDRTTNFPQGFSDRANQFLVEQDWIRFERAVVTNGTTEPTLGFRTDWILGSDYRFTLPRGLFNSQLTANNGQPNLYGIDPVQFYAEAFLPTIGGGLDIKVGRFFALYGVEQISAVDNYLLSHSFTDVFDPFTHTGILGTLKLTDTWSIQTGLVLGSDDFIDRVDVPTGVGSIKWAPVNGRDSVLFSVIVGSGRYNQSEKFSNPNVFDIIYTHQCNARLAYNLEFLYGYQTNVPDTGTARWLGIINYGTYTFTPRLSGTTRLEFFDDAQGERTGFAGWYTALTAGLSFRPAKSVTFRPEIRFNYNEESRAFENRHGLLTAGADVILRW